MHRHIHPGESISPPTLSSMWVCSVHTWRPLHKESFDCTVICVCVFVLHGSHHLRAQKPSVYSVVLGFWHMVEFSSSQGSLRYEKGSEGQAEKCLTFSRRGFDRTLSFGWIVFWQSRWWDPDWQACQWSGWLSRGHTHMLLPISLYPSQ